MSVKQVIFDETLYDDFTLPEFIDWLGKKLGEIPEPCRDKSDVTIYDENMYGESYARLKISYLRPETAEERKDRLATERNREEFTRRREIQTLAALKAKYEGTAS